MRTSVLKLYEGKIVTLDLISGVQVTTRISQVDEAHAEVVCEYLLQYHIQGVRVPDPSQPPSPTNIPQLVGEPAPYGKPMFEFPKTGNRIAADHIMFVIKTPAGLEQLYVKETSGIIPVAGSVLDQLKGLDFSKLGIDN